MITRKPPLEQRTEIFIQHLCLLYITMGWNSSYCPCFWGAFAFKSEAYCPQRPVGGCFCPAVVLGWVLGAS